MTRLRTLFKHLRLGYSALYSLFIFFKVSFTRMKIFCYFSKFIFLFGISLLQKFGRMTTGAMGSFADLNASKSERDTGTVKNGPNRVYAMRCYHKLPKKYLY